MSDTPTNGQAPRPLFEHDPEKVPAQARSVKPRTKGYFVDAPGIDAFVKHIFPGGQVADTLRNPYQEESRIYAAVSLIADAAASVPITVFSTDPSKDEDAQPVPDSDPVARLFAHINPVMDPAEAWERTTLNMELSGGCFWSMTDANGKEVQASDPTDPNSKIKLPEEFWPISQAIVEPIVNRTTNMPIGWKVKTGNGTTKEYAASSLLQFKYPRAYGGIMGQAPLDVARARADQIHKARIYQDSILENGGDPGGVIIAKEMNEEAKGRLTQTIDAQWNDGAMAGDTRLLFGEIEYHPNPLAPKDMEYGKLLEANWQAISEVFRVPPTLLGMRSANFAEHKLHLREFWSIKMLALFRRYENAINSRFLPRLDDPRLAGYRVKFDTSMVEALQGELLDQVMAAKELRDLGMPLNAALHLAGIDTDPVVGGDVSLVPTTLQPLEGIGSPDDEKASPPTPAKTTGPAVASSACASTGAQGAASPSERLSVGSSLADGGVAPGPAVTLTEAEPTEPDESAAEAAQAAEKAAYLRRRAIEESTQKRREPSVRRMTTKAKRWSRKMRTAQLAHLDKIAKGRKKLDPPTAKVYRGPMSKRAADSFLEAWGEKDNSLDLIGKWGDRNGRILKLATVKVSPLLNEVDFDHILYLAHLTKAKLTQAELDKLILAASQSAFWETAFIDQMEAAFNTAFSESASAIAAELDAAALLPSTDTAQAFIKSKLIKVSEGVNSTVAEQLRREYAKIFAEHPFDGTGSLADRLREILPDMKKGTSEQFGAVDRRARTIARTETAQIDSHVREESMKDAGVEKHEWITSGLDNVRDSHRALDGLVRKIDGGTFPIPSGTIRRAHDPEGPPEEVISCACVMSPVFDD